MIIIAGTIDLEPAKRDACLAAGLVHQMATRSDEPGCLAYCFAPDPGVPGRIQVYELWTDEASLAAHFDHPNYHSMRKVFGEHGPVTADNKKYRCDLTEPVYDADRKPRADFITAQSLRTT